MLRHVVTMLAAVAMVTGEMCPPTCHPPRTITGCVTYRRASKCSQNVVDVSASEVVCGCMWQEYILAVEPQANVIFTDGGEECYAWATIKCKSSENVKSKTTVVGIQQSLRQGIGKLQKALLDKTVINIVAGDERAKHRKRNGVGIYGQIVHKNATDKTVKQESANKPALKAGQKETSQGKGFDFIGKSESNGRLSWVEVEPVQDKKGTKTMYPQKWFPWNMEDEEFKLWVFISILLMNVLVVLLAIFCRSDQKSEPKEVRPLGDLDPNMYIQNRSLGKKTPIRSFLEKLRTIKEKKARRSSKYTQLGDGQAWQPINHSYGSTQSDWSNYQRRRPTAGLYDELTDDSIEMDNTYEAPVFFSRPPPPPPPLLTKHDSFRHNNSVQTDQQSKQVSFSLPPDSNDTGTGERRNKGGRSKGPPIFSLGKFLD